MSLLSSRMMKSTSFRTLPGYILFYCSKCFYRWKENTSQCEDLAPKCLGCFEMTTWQSYLVLLADPKDTLTE